MEASINFLGYTNVFSKVNPSVPTTVRKATFNSVVDAGFSGVNPKIKSVYVFPDFISGTVDIQIFQFRVHLTTFRRDTGPKVTKRS